MYSRKPTNNAIILLVASMLIAMSLSGCSSPKSKLLGKWELGTEVIEFFSDSRVSIRKEGQVAAGSWSILDDGRVKLEIIVYGTAYPMTGKLEGDVFQLETPDGEVSTYKKKLES
jgi:hypothetical protein